MSTSASSPDLAVIYLRVSTEDQAKHGYSLPDQRDQCRRKARETTGRDNLQIVEFEDTAGGDILDRPALEKMREFVREHKPGLFVCMDPDRFSRKLSIQLLVTEELEKAGTTLLFVQHDYQKTPEGQLFYSLRGAISEYEKAKILQRTKAGARRKVKQGQVAAGTRPYGYDYDTERDTIVPNPAEARWVQTIFQWAGEKVLPLEIADRLNAMGVPTKYGRLWRSSTIQGMLQNSTYIGQMVCFRWNTAGYAAQKQLPKDKRTSTPKKRAPEEWCMVPVPPIIDEHLFAVVQDTRKKHKRMAKGTAGILSGLARCGLCGGAIHYVADRTMGHVLRCHNRYPRRDAVRKVSKCSLPNVRASIIETKVWAQITDWVVNPESLAENLRREQDAVTNDAEIARLTPMLSEYQRALAGRRKEQAMVVKQMTSGRLDEEVGNTLLDEAKSHINTLLKQIKDTESVIEVLAKATTLENTLYYRVVAMRGETDYDDAAYRHAMENLPEAGRQRVVRMLNIEVLLFPGRECRIVGATLSNHVASETRFDYRWLDREFRDMLL